MMHFVRPVPLRSTPRVSVVVPCYNYGHYLPQLVDSVLDQPGAEVDVLIVDDCSTDGSGEVAERLAADNPSVAVLRHETNRGHIQTYNDGLEKISGDYVVLLSADDLLPAGAVARAVALMEEYSSVGFVYGFARSFSGEPPVPVSRLRNWTIWKGRDWIATSARKARCFISSPEVVMRTDALRQVGGYDPRLPHSGDFDMWLRTALHWDVGRVNGPDQAFYRVHDSNMHLTAYAGMITDLRERRTTFDILFDEHAPDRTDVTDLRQVAMRGLAVESVRRALMGHRDGLDRALVLEYLDFAAKTDPGIRRTLWWRCCEVGPLREARLPAASARRFASRVRHHVAWRCGRRYGL